MVHVDTLGSTDRLVLPAETSAQLLAQVGEQGRSIRAAVRSEIGGPVAVNASARCRVDLVVQTNADLGSTRGVRVHPRKGCVPPPHGLRHLRTAVIARP